MTIEEFCQKYRVAPADRGWLDRELEFRASDNYRQARDSWRAARPAQDVARFVADRTGARLAEDSIQRRQMAMGDGLAGFLARFPGARHIVVQR